MPDMEIPDEARDVWFASAHVRALAAEYGAAQERAVRAAQMEILREMADEIIAYWDEFKGEQQVTDLVERKIAELEAGGGQTEEVQGDA